MQLVDEVHHGVDGEALGVVGFSAQDGNPELGALGGMVTSGIIGLFTGPVILAVGYELFIGWVYQPADVSEVLDETSHDNQP